MRLANWLHASSRGASLKTRAPRQTGARCRRARLNLERLEDRLVLSAGQLDPSFGHGGIVTTDIGGSTTDIAQAVATQADGKVVVAGQTQDVTFGGLGVVRYNSDGSLDTSFGNKGQVTFDFLGSGELGETGAVLTIDPAGHIILAGEAPSADHTSLDLVVVELNADGSFNTSFGQGGTASFTPANTLQESNPASVAVDAAGHIVVGANSILSSSSNPSGILAYEVIRLNSDGSPDMSFGHGGESTISTGPSDADRIAGLAVDASGRVVVAGTAVNNPTSTTNMSVARLNTDGSLDTSFGTGGEATIDVGANDQSAVTGMALDTAGHIVLTGTVNHTVYPFSTNSAVVRLNSDGTLDSTFGTSGVASTGAFGDQIAVDAFNRIVLASYTYVGIPQSGNANAFTVQRLDNQGNLDPSFGTTNGETIIVPGSAAPSLAGVVLDTSGRVIVAGTNSPGFFVSRLTAGGADDTSWGGSGQVTTDIIGHSTDFAVDLTLTQPDGKLVVVGTSQGYPNENLIVARYNADGSLDGTFGQGGKAAFIFDIRSSFNPPQPTAVSTDGSGRLLVAGLISGQFGVLRLNSDGTLDTTFGSGGEATVNSGSSSFFTNGAVRVDGSGRLVVAGTVFASYGTFAVARLNADGSLDTSFGSGGMTTISFGGPGVTTNDVLSGVTIDAAGRIIVAGTSEGQFSLLGKVAVARLNADGSLDTSFGTGGKTTFGFVTGDQVVTVAGVALDPAGHIVVGGTTSTSNFFAHQSFAVARLNAADGSLDQSFGNGGEATLSPINAYSLSASRIAIDSAGRVAVVGSLNRFSNASTFGNEFAAALFKSDGCPDVDFGVGGRVTTAIAPNASLFGSAYDVATGAAFDRAGRLVVAGTTFDPNSPTGEDFAVVRYLAHDSVVEAGSATFAADLQATVTALRATPPGGTPRVVIHVSSPAQMPAVTAALAGLSVNPSGPEIEVLLDVEGGTYSLGSITVPAGLRLVLDGNGGNCGTVTFAGSSAPALTLVSGDVLIRDGVQLSETGSAPALVVLSGQLTMRNSTVTENTTTNQAAMVITGGQVDLGSASGGSDPSNPDFGLNTFNLDGPGVFIYLTGPNNVLAFADSFQLNGSPLYDGYQIEDHIDHSLDGLGGGTVFWVPNTDFVSDLSGSLQRGVNVVPAGGTVNVQTGVKGGYSAGSQLLTVAFENGESVTQQTDPLDANKRELLLQDTANTNDNIKFVAGTNPGEVQVKINNLPNGTFVPTSRLVANGGFGASIQVDSAIFLPAWLYGGGNGRLMGGSGNNVLIGGTGDFVAGGAGRSLLIGPGGNTLTSRGGQDLIIAGSTSYDTNEVALAAIMDEWTSADTLATRVANLTDDTANPLFSASRHNGNDFLIGSGPNRTVFWDSSADTVNVNSSLDVIFASVIDTLNGLIPEDVVIPLPRN